MSDEVIESIRDKIFSRLSPDSTPTVVWHAGEPTVAPISWYERSHRILTSVAPKATRFSIQSNGVYLSERWIDFLRRTNTTIGLSIDGPQQFHDARRKTRAGGPTWALVMRNLRRLQECGLDPNVISVLQPSALSAAREYYYFYRDNNIHHVGFSIDEKEGANAKSSFDGLDYKSGMVLFIYDLLSLAFADGYALHIREVERIAHCLAEEGGQNEQVEPWQAIVIGVNGDVTTFSPEFMEIKSPTHNNFCFGNILRDTFEDLVNNEALKRTEDEIRRGVELCHASCKYFGICGGGAPANKMSENGSLESTETSFCRLSTQAPADALLKFLSQRRSTSEGQSHNPFVGTASAG